MRRSAGHAASGRCVVACRDRGHFHEASGCVSHPRAAFHPTWCEVYVNRTVQRSPLHGLAEHLHRDWAHPTHICVGTGLTRAHGAPLIPPPSEDPRSCPCAAGLTAGRALRIGGSEPWLSTGFDTAASLALLQPWISGTGMDPAIDSRMCAHTSVIHRAQAASQVAQARASAMSAYIGPRAACHVQPTSCKPKRATVGRVLPLTRRPRFFVSRACRRRSDADCNGLSNACLRQMAELIHALFVRAGGGMFDGRGRALAQTSRRKQSHRSTSLCRLQCSYMRRRTRSSRSSRCSRSKCVFPLARPANSAIGACMPRCRWAATRPVDAAPGASLRFRAAYGVVERCAGVAECAPAVPQVRGNNNG